MFPLSQCRPEMCCTPGPGLLTTFFLAGSQPLYSMVAPSNESMSDPTTPAATPSGSSSHAPAGDNVAGAADPSAYACAVAPQARPPPADASVPSNETPPLVPRAHLRNVVMRMGSPLCAANTRE